jgi:hypothetical protein
MMNRFRQVIKEMFKSPLRFWNERSDAQTPMYVVGVILILSGLFHVFVWLFSGESLEGPVSWRKPIAFGISGGITTLSVAWVMHHLNQRKSLLTISRIFAVFMFVEVGLITMQKWRGVASHFNTSTPFNAFVFSTMGLLITVIAILILLVTIYSFRDPIGNSEMALAVRSGLVFLNLGNLLGMLIIGYGNYVLITNPGHPPNIFGASGIMKVPHAVALHAIQILPFFAWLLSLSLHDSKTRLKISKLAVAAYSGLQIFVLMQTFSGRTPWDLSFVSTGVIAVSTMLSVVAVLMAISGKMMFKPQETSHENHI